MNARGRPRDEALDRKIVEAALAEFDARGYAGLSIDGVAQRAGVGKATIYRRYSGKADLLTRAIAAQKSPIVASPDKGTAREQMVESLERTRRRMIDDGYIHTVAQILAESQRNPELLELHRERTIAARRAEFESILDHGVSTGEIRPDLDRELCFELCVGAWLAGFTTGNDFAGGWAERVIDLVWPAIAR